MEAAAAAAVVIGRDGLAPLLTTPHTVVALWQPYTDG